MDARCLVGVGVGVLLVLAGCSDGQPGGEPSPTLSLDWDKMEQRRIEASQRAEARASASAAASASASATPAGPYVWKEIPEPTLPPEAQAQAGFAEAELAAKYFVELELYVRQTNDTETWQKVIHPESSGGKNVVDRALRRQEKGIRLAYDGLSVNVLESGVAVENENSYRVYLTLSANREYSVNIEGGVVSDNGEISYFSTVFIEYVDGRWRLINSGYDAHRPEEL